MCVYLFTCKCKCTSECVCGGQKTTWGVGHCPLPCLVQNLCLTLYLPATILIRLAGLKTEDSPVSTYHLAVGVLGLQMCFSVPDSIHGFWRF